MTEQISVGEGRIEVTKYDGKAGVSSYIVCADRESVNDVQYLQKFYKLREEDIWKAGGEVSRGFQINAGADGDDQQGVFPSLKRRCIPMIMIRRATDIRIISMWTVLSIISL